jgi:hypothetical protein
MIMVSREVLESMRKNGEIDMGCYMWMRMKMMVRKVEWRIVRMMSFRMSNFWFWIRDVVVKDVRGSWRCYEINEIGLVDSLRECRSRFWDIESEFGNEDEMVSMDMVVWIDEGIGKVEEVF